jgi:putative ABC transport system permease protein
MRPLDFLREALSDLRANKLRSLLTGLGVIIGVGSVTLLLSLGEGVRAEVGTAFSELGTTRLVVTPAGGGAGVSASTLTLDDVAAIATVPGVRDVAPTLTIPLRVRGGAQDVTMPVIGTTAPYFGIAGDPILAGTAFAGQDDAVIDESAARSLFGSAEPGAALGREVEAAGAKLRVVGVVSDPALMQSFGGSAGASLRMGFLYAPLERLMSLTKQQYVSQVNLRADEPTRVEAVRVAVQDLLEQRHGVRDIQTFSLARILSQVNQALSVITGFLAALAGISLLVGGIGIMNIMLAVVAERTREIGIIRALGATRIAVVVQFLAEAVLISLLGGVVGLAVALAAGAAIESALEVPAVVSAGIVALALGVSSVVGIVFGVLPAWRAARLDPIRALRHD